MSSYERREEFADVARRNVDPVLRRPEASHPAWKLTVGDLAEALPARRRARVDRVVLDMLAPWECVDAVADALRARRHRLRLRRHHHPARAASSRRCAPTAGSPSRSAWESLVRDWHVEGLAVRPGHKMIGHTGFLVTARRMAPGQRPPVKKRRPAPGRLRAGLRRPAARPDLPPQVAGRAVVDGLRHGP